MNINELIIDLRSGLGDLKEKGLTQIPIANIEAYLDAISKDVTTPPANDYHAREYALKKWELNTEIWKSDSARQHETNLEQFKSVIEAGGTALKSATLINGGAVIALLAFLGNIMSKEPYFGQSLQVAALNRSMAAFVCGVGFAGLASGARYIAQACYFEKSQAIGDRVRYFAVGFALLSFAAFFVGAWSAHRAIS
jgi:hypothetical protein